MSRLRGEKWLVWMIGGLQNGLEHLLYQKWMILCSINNEGWLFIKWHIQAALEACEVIKAVIIDIKCIKSFPRAFPH